MVPSKPTVKTKPDYIKEFAPFLVPRDDGKSKTRFLVCKFSAVSKDAGLVKEMDQKMIPCATPCIIICAARATNI